MTLSLTSELNITLEVTYEVCMISSNIDNQDITTPNPKRSLNAVSLGNVKYLDTKVLKKKIELYHNLSV